jgi:hypothetical protein
MIDYPTLKQQAAFAARIGSLSEAVAKRIVALPEDQREAGLTMVRRNYAAELRQNGLDNEHGCKWLDLHIEAIRRLVAEIETSGFDRPSAGFIEVSQQPMIDTAAGIAALSTHEAARNEKSPDPSERVRALPERTQR